MKVFLAGASGVIGIRMIPLMIAEEITVAAMTRSPEKLDQLYMLGAVPVLCDIFDRDELIAAVKIFEPDVILHQVTNLPDDIERLAEFSQGQARVRSEGTHNLLAAAREAAVPRFVAQSIAWNAGPVVDAHEQAVIAAGGTVLRYGQFYGPGTYYEDARPPEPCVQIDIAARSSMPFLTAPPGIALITDATANG